MSRPECRYDPPPDGYAWTAVPAGPQWRLETGRRCRFAGQRGQHRCTADAVAALNRSHWRTEARPSWWAYCAEHMYGRWVEDGRVMQWVLRPATSGEANDADLPV